VREWLHDGETGYLVPPKDPEAIAARAGELMADQALNRRMGERGIALIRERFSIEGHVSRLEAIYERVAGS
jgi:glycosyltransferase involved in cell wall biosynthesis